MSIIWGEFYHLRCRRSKTRSLAGSVVSQGRQRHYRRMDRRGFDGAAGDLESRPAFGKRGRRDVRMGAVFGGGVRLPGAARRISAHADRRFYAAAVRCPCIPVSGLAEAHGIGGSSVLLRSIRRRAFPSGAGDLKMRSDRLPRAGFPFSGRMRNWRDAKGEGGRDRFFEEAPFPFR